MNTQNVTLSVPREILQKIKVIAARQNTSISALMTHTLAQIVAREEGYQSACRSHLQTLNNGIALGTGGDMAWAREDLHER
jgi:predicted transcriptional regulator